MQESTLIHEEALRAALDGPQRSLVSRLTHLNLLVLSITLVLCFGLVASSAWFAARERQIQAAEASASLLANNLASMMVFEDRPSATAELQAVAKRGDLVEILVLDQGNRIFAQWARTTALGTVQSPATAPAGLGAQGFLTEVHGEQIVVWVEVRLRGERIGALMLRESLATLIQAAWQLVTIAALLILMAILLASLVLRFVQRRALSPLIELSRLAEAIAQDQNYGRRAVVHQDDEVGRLTERFNQMLKRVEAAQVDLNQRLAQESAAGRQFEQLAHQDSLTKLPNRLYFQAELQRQLTAALNQNGLMALMYIDLDNFKTVNDTLGHEAGDEVLIEVSRRMSNVLRSSDVLCRLGGDEFALILPHLQSEADAEQLAVRLIAAVREPMHIQGQLMPVGATVGLAFCPVHAVNTGSLLASADSAMYAAKRAGKNTFRRAG